METWSELVCLGAVYFLALLVMSEGIRQEHFRRKPGVSNCHVQC